MTTCAHRREDSNLCAQNANFRQRDTNLCAQKASLCAKKFNLKEQLIK